jgi:glycosyltransferase involved in cell wall biosynthesis
MHAAVANLWPDVPVVTHLHGTELKMLASAEDESTGVNPRWTQEWVARMQQWAGRSDRIVVVARHDQELAEQLLPIEAGRISVVAGGVDTEIFAPRHRTARERLALWKRVLVDEPRGWRPGQPEGSVRYDVADLAAFSDPRGTPVPVVLFAGRFMRFKRLQLLIEAHHHLRSTTQCRSVLVVAGGFPGEWEGEHPYDTVRRLGAADVFFVGWQGHGDLAEIFNCSDVFAAPAVDEPFGLVYLEAMASGIPPIGTTTGGPLSFVNVDADNPTGWLVPPDDVEATARALAEAVSDPTARRQRGDRAVSFIREHYSWGSSAKAIAALYDEVSDESRPLMPSQPEQSTTGVA